jgi:arginase family enzyme
MLADRLGVTARTVGTPEPALNASWDVELAAAASDLKAMAQEYESVMRAGLTPVTALSRCAVALATLPVMARHRADSCVVWFDSHPDLNTPETSTTGYLGGLALAGALGLWDSGLGTGLNLSQMVFCGIRDVDQPEQDLLDRGEVPVVLPGETLVHDLRRSIRQRPVYVHVDCDVLNPGVVPAEYQVSGGLSLSDLHAACEVLAESEVVGVQIAEYQIAWDEGGSPVSPVELLDAIQPLMNAARGPCRRPSNRSAQPAQHAPAGSSISMGGA